MTSGVSRHLKVVIMIFKSEWEKVKVDSKHAAFRVRLKSAITAYNAKHL